MTTLKEIKENLTIIKNLKKTNKRIFEEVVGANAVIMDILNGSVTNIVKKISNGQLNKETFYTSIKEMIKTLTQRLKPASSRQFTEIKIETLK